jgi:hypothetical protein
VLLNGTTIEEVRDRLKDTLQLVMDVVNEEAPRIRQAQEDEKAAKAREQRAHRNNVRDIAPTRSTSTAQRRRPSRAVAGGRPS